MPVIVQIICRLGPRSRIHRADSTRGGWDVAKSKTGEKPLYGGVDIGGTKIRALVTSESGEIRAVAKRKTKAENGFPAVIERAVDTLANACKDAGTASDALTSVGFGIPSAVLPNGRAADAPNLGWKDVPLLSTIRRHLSVPVFADNDVNAGTFGEYMLGAGREAKTLVGYFVGTGLGGGIVMDGRLVRGQWGLAGELGHVVVQAGGRRCGCGRNGCLEAYASKSGMGRRLGWEVQMQGRTTVLTELCGGDYGSLRSSQLAEAYTGGDALAVELLHELADMLGVGVAGMITALGADTVVLGGGVMEALGEPLLPRVRNAARDATFPGTAYEKCRIVLAKLEDDAVALGAMLLARDALGAESAP